MSKFLHADDNFDDDTAADDDNDDVKAITEVWVFSGNIRANKN